MSATALPVTERSRLHRLPERGTHERAAIDAIVDEGLICHLGFTVDEQPFVVPTIHGRIGDTVYVHGSVASRMLRALTSGPRACLTVTLVDGLVVARSAFHHSMNYRSVMLFAAPRLVSDPEEKAAALHAIVEHVVPGQMALMRPHSERELKVTNVLAFPIEEGSAKVRTGPPIDDEEDYALDLWAGVIPLSLAAGTPYDDGRVRPGVSLPAHLAHYRRGAGPAE